MSRLILKGDLIKNFGEFYPVPYIEQVHVRGGGDTRVITLAIDYSFLFLAPEPETTSEDYDIAPLLSAAANLNFYFLVTKTVGKTDPNRSLAEATEAAAVISYASAVDGVIEPGMLHTDTTTLTPTILPTHQIAGVTDSLDELALLTYNSSLLVEFMKSDGPLTDYGFDIIVIDREDLYKKIESRDFGEFYDAQGRRILKVSGLVTHEIDFEETEKPSPGAIGPIPEKLGVNLLSFASMLTQNEFQSSTQTTNTALTTFVGDIAYEKILVDGDVPNQTEISYFDSNNEMYMETPLQAINKKYYKLNTISREQILDRFKQVLDAYEPLTQTGKGKKKVTDETLISSINLVRFALDEYKDKIDLIPRINAARRSFVEKTTGTSTGALFADLTKLVRNSTTALKRSPELTKRLTVNSKIIDARTVFNSGYELPPFPDDISEDVLNFKLGRSVITTNDKTTTETLLADAGLVAGGAGSTGGGATFDMSALAEGSIMLRGSDGKWYTLDISDPVYNGLNNDIYFTYEEYNISFGYVLFDYQTYLIKNSYLAEICDVAKFIETFSMEYLQGFFTPRKLILKKSHPITEDDWSATGADPTLAIQYDLPLQKVDTEADAEYSPTDTFANPAGTFIDPGATTLEYPAMITTKNSITIRQYIAQRNAELALSENSGYRMMAFEFQNIDRKAVLERWDERVYDEYFVALTIADNTKQALTGVIAQYLIALGALNEYLLEAEAACSYNNIDGIFNDFFAESMTEKYSSLPSASPWIYAVVTYIKHLDFLTNRYDGDEGQMLLAAKETIQKISPQTGTLPLLQAFYTKMEGLSDETYSSTSAIGVYITASDPDASMWDPYSKNHRLTKTFDTLTEATFIEDDRNQFLAVKEAQARALGRLGVALDKAERAEDARMTAEALVAAELAAEAEIMEKVNYEYDNIKFKTDGSGCNYVVKCTDTSKAGEYWWVNPYYIDEFLCRYTHGRPSRYVVRQRELLRVSRFVVKCRSRQRKDMRMVTGTSCQYLGTQNTDWNDDTGGDPNGESTLKQKLRDSEPI